MALLYHTAAGLGRGNASEPVPTFASEEAGERLVAAADLTRRRRRPAPRNGTTPTRAGRAERQRRLAAFSTSGAKGRSARAPYWPMISAAHSEPKRPQAARSSPRVRPCKKPAA